MSWLTSKLKIEKPEHIQCTLTITMSLDGWVKLRKYTGEIKEHYFGPVGELRAAIQSLVDTATKEFSYEPKEEADERE